MKWASEEVDKRTGLKKREERIFQLEQNIFRVEASEAVEKREGAQQQDWLAGCPLMMGKPPKKNSWSQ